MPEASSSSSSSEPQLVTRKRSKKQNMEVAAAPSTKIKVVFFGAGKSGKTTVAQLL